LASASNKQLELWKQYADTKNPAIKEQLIIEYSNIVKYMQADSAYTWFQC